MTQNQLEWMQKSGLDPAEYDMTPDGRVIRRQPVQAPVEPQREVMSPLRAAGTSFLGNVLPSAAGFGGAIAAPAAAASLYGAPLGPVGMAATGILGALGAGYLTGKGQEAALEKLAPEALQQMAQAEQDQPIYSYLGGFAPNALAFRPSVKGMSGLLRPAGIRGTETLREALAKPEFLAPAMNIGVNVAGSTAGQLVNMSQGGEFSAPRFAADVAFGTLFNRPTALGRKIGFHDIPEPRQEAPGDLAAARQKAEFMEYPPQDFITPREERGAQDVKTPGVNITPEGPEQFFTAEGKRMTEKAMAKDYTNWWKSETEPTTDLIKQAAEEIKMKVPREKLAELAQDPEVGAALRDPSRMPAFIAKQAEQSLEDVYQMMLRAETKGKFATPEEAAKQRALQELRAERGLPSETPLSDVEAAYAARQRTATGQAQELYGPELAGRAGRPPSVGQVAKADKTAYEAYSGVRPETQNATEAAREIYTRLQRAPEEYTGKITQEDINLATEIANRRGLKIELDRAYAGDQQVRGLYMVDKKTGDRIIRINPLMATPDTAIHEIGHDVFTGVTNKGMRRSLLDSALDSPAYKAELAARAEEVKQGKITQEQANDIALEEGLIQAFGEQMPQVKRGELRAWYQAFKASMKQLVTGKMSPEDALAWMHYATTEAVPWKGAAVAKVGDVGEERMQRAQQETPEFKAWFGGSQVTDQTGAPKVVYHGTGANIEAFNKALLDKNALYGPGIYLTESKGVAGGESGYAFKGLKNPDEFAGEYSVDETLPAAEQIKQAKAQALKEGKTPEEVDSYTWVADAEAGKRTGLVYAYEAGSDQGPNVMPLYANIKNAFDIDAIPQDWSAIAEEMDDVANRLFRDEYNGINFDRLARLELMGNIDGQVLYKNLAQSFTLATPRKAAANVVLQAMGYDGITHTGGLSGRYGSGEPHKVWIAFEPEQVKSALGNRGTFSPESTNIRYQRAQQETPEFKNWFGDSKVVDEQGKPLVVYHGTDAPDFTEFRTKTGYNFGPGAYFTPEPTRAAEYARTSTGSRIYPAYVSLENPYRVTSDATLQDIGYKIRKDPANEPLLKQLMDKYDARNSDILGNGEIGNAWLREQGYDGIIKERQRYTENGFVPEILEVVAFKPEQVKSATANRGTFSRENPDIRYQRSLGSEIVRPSELDYLASKGGPFERVATPMRAAYNTRDFKAGEWSSKYSLAAELRPEDQKRLFVHLSQEFDNNTRSTPPSDLRAAYDQIRNEYLPAIVNDYNAAGMTVRDTAGLRARGTNPAYIPLHDMSEPVKDILRTKQGSPEYDKLKNDFLQWNTQLRQADGASLAEAQKYALEKFEEKINITSKPPGIESGIPFSGARKPEGYPLPPSWRSDDLIGNLDNYTRRSATDYAYQKHVESSPEAMAALGAKKYFNDQPIPANILASTANVINEPSVQSILREYRGTPAQKVGGNVADVGRMVTVSTIGPVSKVGDIGTSLVKGLVYLPAGEYTSGLVDFTNRLGDWAALKERSYASGLNKRDGAQNMRQVLGIGDDSVSFMAKAAETLSKFTGLNQLETVARTIAQGWGETVVKYNKRLALSGDKNATQMLDTLSPDWRTRSDADLAAQVGRLLQGSYDMRQLPASVLEGAAAPYLTWSKWSIGQYDSFMKYALRPAMQGNVKPLIGQMLIGVLGGGAVSAVQEWINNREGKDITWNELESWMQQNQGQLGADGGQLLGQKLLTMAQKLGTFGFAGDVVKMVIDTMAGGTAQGVATMPALDAVYDVSKRVAAATKALDDGEDFGLVLKALMQDSVIGHLQVARLARNWLDEDENLRYDDRRRRRLYDELTGMPSRGGAFTVNYSNLSEREFERGEITPQTGEEALGLVTRAREQATTPEDYASRIRKLKTAQNAIMPSLERQPLKAARYLSWLEGTEEGLGGETMRRYLIREQEDLYRKRLIEGMSGLR